MQEKNEYKWYGKKINSHYLIFKNIEQNYFEIFSSLENKAEMNYDLEPGEKPDLRNLIISYGHRKVMESLSWDFFLIKEFSFYNFLTEEINSIYERASSLAYPESYDTSIEKVFSLLENSKDYAISEVGRISKNIVEMRKILWDDMEKKVNEKLKNTVKMCGPLVTLELLNIYGSFKKLAFSNASSIQMAGAERSLFLSKTKNIPNPKYGVIFKSPVLGKIQGKNKGKAARRLSYAISLALKFDYEGKDMDQILISKLMEKIISQ
ncbi:hypothetical protein [Caldiplasma sukawensis]